MKNKLTTQYIKGINHTPEKMERHWDSDLKGFLLQITAKSTMTFYYRYSVNGKQQSYKIGNYPDITATQARNIAKEKAGEVAKGIDIQSIKKANRRKAEAENKTTFSGYIEHVYKNYLLTEKKSGKKILQAIESHFKQWNNKQLTNINVSLVEDWRTQQLKNGRKPGAVNRPIAYLRSMLNNAYGKSIIDNHPLAKFKQLKEDSVLVRYLSDDEESRLRQAMKERDNNARLKRDSANLWRKNRDLELLPPFSKNSYCDHLTPIVLIALNTGMRRGEIFSMQWIDIDFKAKTLAVRGENSKTSKTRIIPLNNEAFSVLMKWEKQAPKKLLIFPGKNDQKLTDIKTAFKNLLKSAKIMTTAEAKQKELPIINGFWFHALRHTFASKLAMKGVDLNTIRELLGHSDIKMTMKYAHLSPNHKSEAVNLLNN